MKGVNRTTVPVAFFFGLLLAVAAGSAQPKTEKRDRGLDNAPAVAQAPAHCPMRQLRDLADVKAEKTRDGASLSFSAKDPAKLLEVQALVEKLARCVKGEAGAACKCSECEGGHHMMRHGNTTK